MADDIITRLKCIYVTDGCGQCTFCVARDEIRQLLVHIEQLKSDKHWLNERLLNAQTDIQLLEARARRND